MRDDDKTKEQLIEELVELRHQLLDCRKQDSLEQGCEKNQEQRQADQKFKESSDYITKENHEIIDYLKNSRLFSHLPESLIRQLVPLSEFSEYPAGT
ncbi:hypothetical protein KJ966_05130 [bacterium]|nr:hypothetical protein [bacterium]